MGNSVSRSPHKTFLGTQKARTKNHRTNTWLPCISQRLALGKREKLVSLCMYQYISPWIISWPVQGATLYCLKLYSQCIRSPGNALCTGSPILCPWLLPAWMFCLSLHIYCQGGSVIFLCVPNLEVYYPGVAYSYHGTMLGMEKSVVLVCNEYKTFHMIEIQIQTAKSLAAENNKSN